MTSVSLALLIALEKVIWQNILMKLFVSTAHAREMSEMYVKWIIRPICGNKTRVKLRPDTVLINFPLYCPKCKQENLIRVKDFHITIIKEPDAKTQSR